MKFKKNDIKIMKKAIEKYGEENQKIIAIEEMNELSHIICKSFRKNNFNNYYKDLITEIADVYIMLEQLKIMTKLGNFFEDKIKEEINFKIKRLEELINQ